MSNGNTGVGGADNTPWKESRAYVPKSKGVAGKEGKQVDTSKQRRSEGKRDSVVEEPKSVEARKMTKPYQLSNAREDWSRLKEKTSERLERYDKVHTDLQTRIDRLSLPVKVAKDIRSKLEFLFKQYKNLRASVVNNLNYMTQALGGLKYEGMTKEQEIALSPALEALGKAKTGVEQLLSKSVDELTKEDLDTARATIADFMIQLNNCTEQFDLTKLTPSQLENFEENLDKIGRMTAAFDRAMSVLSDKADVRDTVIPMPAEEGFEETIKGWLEEIKQGDFEKKTFWVALTGIIGVLGIALFVVSITVALCVLSGGAAIALGVVGGVLGTTMGTAGGVAFGINITSDYETDEKFKQILKTFPWLEKELSKVS